MSVIVVVIDLFNETKTKQKERKEQNKTRQPSKTRTNKLFINKIIITNTNTCEIEAYETEQGGANIKP